MVKRDNYFNLTISGPSTEPTTNKATGSANLTPTHMATTDMATGTASHLQSTRRAAIVLADRGFLVVASNIVPGDEVSRVKLVEDGQAPLVVVFAVVGLRDAGAGGGRRERMSG